MTAPENAIPSKTAGRVPVAVVMISFNEAHNMTEVLQNISGWAQEVFLVDSYSTDETVGLALAGGVKVVQRRFRGFGDQWNFALRELPITAPWTIKLDPDERLSEELKTSIAAAIQSPDTIGIQVQLRLWFMGRPLPIRQPKLRVWRTGKCRFAEVSVNEYPLVEGHVDKVRGELEHHDSPDLHHWCEKQNRYTSIEALAQFERRPLAVEPRLFGSALQRRMWLKRHFWMLPGRFALMFLYHLVFLGSWRAGRVGWIWSRLRTELYRTWEYKLFEMRMRKRPLSWQSGQPGRPDDRVRQYDH